MTDFGLPLRLAPLQEEYERTRTAFDVVPVALELQVDNLTPVGAFESFAMGGEGFLLESVEEGQRYGRFSFLGRNALGSFVSYDGEQSASGLLSSISGSPFDATEAALSLLSTAPTIGCDVTHVPLVSGVVGLFGWDAIRSLERLPARKPGGPLHPDIALCLVGELVVFDHWRQSVILVVNANAKKDQFGDVVQRMVGMATNLASPVTPSLRPSFDRADQPTAAATCSLSGGQYRSMVLEAKEAIANGDVFQIVLSKRFDIGLIPDPFLVYRSLRHLNPSAYLYFVRLGGVQVVGSSPEALVRVRGNHVSTRPIAGSRPRSESDRENALRAASLREDPKEIAEHIMLVDLGRNDIGRVSSYGSVKVEELMTVEMYSHIMHLTSEVSGELREGVNAVDVLRATFPAGTLSGAPKVRAMELITEMEPDHRGLYGGAVGYFDSRGNFDAAILIRTLVVDQHDQGSVQAGAGIVWDSDPVLEDEECNTKAEAILRAVGVAGRS